MVLESRAQHDGRSEMKRMWEDSLTNESGVLKLQLSLASGGVFGAARSIQAQLMSSRAGFGHLDLPSIDQHMPSAPTSMR